MPKSECYCAGHDMHGYQPSVNDRGASLLCFDDCVLKCTSSSMRPPIMHRGCEVPLVTSGIMGS